MWYVFPPRLRLLETVLHSDLTNSPKSLHDWPSFFKAHLDRLLMMAVVVDVVHLYDVVVEWAGKEETGVGVTSLWLIVSFWDRKCRHVASRKDWNESGMPTALCNHLIGYLVPSSRNLHYLRHTYVWFWSLALFWTINLGEYGNVNICSHCWCRDFSTS